MRGYLSSISSAYKAESGIKYFVSIPNVGLKWYDESFPSLGEESNLNNLRDTGEDESYLFSTDDKRGGINSSQQGRRCGWIYGGNILPVSVKSVGIAIDTEDYKEHFQRKRKTLRSDDAYEQQRQFWSGDLYPFIITISSFAESSPDVIYTVDVYLGASSEHSRQQWVLHIQQHVIPLQRFLLFSRCNGDPKPSLDVFHCCRALCVAPIYIPGSKTLKYTNEISLQHRFVDSNTINSIQHYLNWYHGSMGISSPPAGVAFIHLELSLALEYAGLNDEVVTSLCELIGRLIVLPIVPSLPPSNHSLTLSLSLEGNALTGDGLAQIFSTIRSAAEGYQGNIVIPCVELSHNSNLNMSDSQAAAIAGILQSMGGHDVPKKPLLHTSMRLVQLEKLNLSDNPQLSAGALYHLMIPLASHHSRLLAVDFSHSPQVGDVAATFVAMLMYNKPSLLSYCSLSHCCLTGAGVMELAQAMPQSVGSLRSMQISGYSPEVDCLLPLVEAINLCLSRSSGQVHISIGGLIQELSASPACRSLRKALPHLAESITMCGVSLRRRAYNSSREIEPGCGEESIVVQIQVRPVKSRASNGQVVAVYSPEELVGLLALHLHASPTQFVILSVSGYSRDSTMPYFLAVEVSCTHSAVEFELFQLHRRHCLAAQQQQPHAGSDYRAGGASMAPSLTAQSIVDTLMYMAKNSHPILHRLGLQHIRVARSRDCANDFSGCKHRFQFVSEQSPVNAEKYLRQGACHPHTLTCLVAYMVCYPVSRIWLMLTHTFYDNITTMYTYTTL